MEAVSDLDGLHLVIESPKHLAQLAEAFPICALR